MQTAIRFAGICPTCGRYLHIPIDLHGKWVRCHGCSAEFRATGRQELGQHEAVRTSSDHQSMLDMRVDSLLAAADRQLHQACVHTSR